MRTVCEAPDRGVVREGDAQQGSHTLLGCLVAAFVRLCGRILRLFGRKKSAAGMGAPASGQDLAERLREQQRQVSFLKSVFESTSDAVVVADLQGEIFMFNRGAEDIFGIGPELACGDNLFRLITDCAVKNGRSHDGKDITRILMRDERIVNMRLRFARLDDGRVTPTLFTLNFVEDASGEPTSIVAVIKDNSEVERLTQIDALTGLHNRRAFDERVIDEHERMRRDHTKVMSLLFLDLDHFGAFNKEHGHQVGDEVLRRVAGVLKGTIRVIDTAARYGGEEFTVILPGTDEQGAGLTAERIRTAISELRVPTGNGRPLSVTASIGFRTHRPDSGDCEGLIRDANEAMLAAKNNGRNRVVAHPGNPQ